MNDARRDFFVSYTSADRRWAEWIAHTLEAAGFTVVIQAWDFRPGSNFVIEMQRALQSSERLIAVLSPAYLKARFPQPEWAAVFAADPEGARRRLVPVMVERCEPDGLLSQVVQIRLYGLDDATAKRELLEGVRVGRAKPSEPPSFPGAAANTGLSAANPAGSRSGARLVWRPLSSPPDVVWRSSLEDRFPNQVGNQAVELHLVPVAGEARLQVRDLTDLSDALPRYGREHGIFSPVEALDVQVDSTRVTVISTARGVVAGLAVTRSGQRSTWTGLPRDMLGAVLDELHVADELARMLDALAGLPLPEPELVMPVVGIEPANMVSVGRVADLPRSSAQIGHGMPKHVRPAPEDAVAFAAIAGEHRAVALELAARLVAEHKTAARLR